jgi:hypothetical protein
MTDSSYLTIRAQVVVLQAQVTRLERENAALHQRLIEIVTICHAAQDIDIYPSYQLRRVLAQIATMAGSYDTQTGD